MRKVAATVDWKLELTLVLMKCFVGVHFGCLAFSLCLRFQSLAEATS